VDLVACRSKAPSTLAIAIVSVVVTFTVVDVALVEAVRHDEAKAMRP
jgi:hypothetical protein